MCELTRLWILSAAKISGTEDHRLENNSVSSVKVSTASSLAESSPDTNTCILMTRQRLLIILLGPVRKKYKKISKREREREGPLSFGGQRSGKKEGRQVQN